MQVVGVDFGTTNVRLSIWDSDRPEAVPESCLIGQGDASAMPAVIAFQRQPDGSVATVVGEDAELLQDGAETVVVDNIKRLALAGDPYVRWHLESRRTPWPTWWNPNTRCVEVWGQEFPVRELLQRILSEAFGRANLTGEFEWRAGCPVHAGLDYRSELAEVLSELGGENKISSVIEEPILFLVLANRLGKLDPGSYMVYDVGGGSFDCALAEVGTDGEMTVYAAHGNPKLGGALIDELLREKLGYPGSALSLKLAKEQVSPSDPIRALDGGFSLGWPDVEQVLDEAKFVGWTQAAMREAYIVAKVLWKPEEGKPPIGYIPSCRLADMPAAFRKDLHSIFLTGGPTKSPYFRDRLAEIFGDQVVTTEEVVPPNVPDPELTGLSMGACYMYDDEQRRPLYVNRLPARVTLRDTVSGQTVEYKPYQQLPYRHLAPNFNPAKPFVSDPLPPRQGLDAAYDLTVTGLDGEILEHKAVDFAQGGVTRGALRSPSLVIDTFGRVGVDNNGKAWVEIQTPHWQTDRHRQVLQGIIERQQEFERNERARVHWNTSHNPFGWQSGHG